MLTRRLLMSVTAAAMLVLPAQGFAETPLKVVATTGMIADTARRIGGEHVDVQALMGPGVDPHAYRQTRSDIVAMTRADLVLWHGLYLEAQMEDFLLDLDRRRDAVAVGEAVPKDMLIAHEEYENRFDPHIWMSPTLWHYVADAIEAELIRMRPEDATEFKANAAAFSADLDKLTTYAETALTSVPEGQRVLLTAHDAFSYFGRNYGYEVLGIQGISTESEAGLNRISELVDTLVARKISAAFVETSVSDRNMRALLEGAAAKGQTTEIGGELFSDAMGPDGTYEATYLGMIDHNITTITRALGGDAPERGMNDKLSAGM